MLGLSVFASTFLLAAPVGSGTAPRIDWRATAGCPPATVLQARLATQIDRSHASGIINATPWRAAARVRRGDGGYVLDGRIDWPGHRWQRQLEAQSCEALADAFILLLVSELEAGAGLTATTRPPQVNERPAIVDVPPPPPVAAENAPQPPTQGEQAPPPRPPSSQRPSEQPEPAIPPRNAPNKVRKPRSTRADKPRRAPPSLGLQLGLGPILGVLPNISGELRLGLHLRWPLLSLVAGGRASAPSRWRADSRDGISALFGHGSFDLGVCLNLPNKDRRWSVPLCAMGHLGMIWARSRGLGSGSRGTVAGLSLEVAGEVGPSLRIRPNLRLSWLFSAAWQAIGERYYIAGLRDQYTPKPWSLRSALVIEFQLWPRPWPQRGPRSADARDQSAQLRPPGSAVLRAPRPQRAAR